jgi:hypothetical protein
MTYSDDRFSRQAVRRFPARHLGEFLVRYIILLPVDTVSVDQSIYRREHPATNTVRTVLINSMDEMYPSRGCNLAEWKGHLIANAKVPIVLGSIPAPSEAPTQWNLGSGR